MIKKILAICLILVLGILQGCSCSVDVDEASDYTEVTEPATEIETYIPGPLYGKVIVIDPGHGVTSVSRKETIAPGSGETKPAFVSGTRGANQTEEELNLSVAFKLRDALQALDATVYMTREVHECEVSNIDRAVFANDLQADISVKLHADGNNSSSAKGVSVLVPGGKYITDEYVITESRKAADLVLEEFVNSTGANNRGISVRNDMTGFNWSSVPVILVEMGFMTNPEEDALMETEEYQWKMVEGITKGLIRYFE